MTQTTEPFEWPQEKSWRSAEMVDAWEEYDLDSIPRYLVKCPVCKALLAESWDQEAHKEWHLRMGG